MAASTVPSTQYLSSQFVVSAGSVLFRNNDDRLQICILYERRKHEWLLPKGRKDCGESIERAAVRETFEETGYACELWPHRMPTRAPSPNSNTPDVARIVDDAAEPIAITVRQLGEKGLKLIWWFITRVSKDGDEKVEGTQTDTEEFDSQFVDAEEAIARLTFQGDKDIAIQALAIVEGDGETVGLS